MVTKDFRWLIKFADIMSAKHEDVVKEICAEVFFQWLQTKNKEPGEYVVHLIRYLHLEHKQQYNVVKKIINEKYEECFPGCTPYTSRDVMNQLRKIE